MKIVKTILMALFTGLLIIQSIETLGLFRNIIIEALFVEYNPVYPDCMWDPFTTKIMILALLLALVALFVSKFLFDGKVQTFISLFNVTVAVLSIISIIVFRHTGQLQTYEEYLSKSNTEIIKRRN